MDAPQAPSITPEAISGWVSRRSGGPACSPRALRITKDSAYVACGAQGLWVIKFHADREPEIVERRDLGGDVVDLFEREGRLWAEVTRVEALPVATLPDGEEKVEQVAPAVAADRAPRTPRPGPRPKERQATAKKRTHGFVVAIEGDTPIVDLGTQDGVGPGNRIEILQQDEASLDPDEETYSPLAVGRVLASSSRRSRVEFGLNERIPVGARARLTKRALSASSVPRRLTKLWEVSVLAGPFIPMDDLGLGILAEGRASYRLEGGTLGLALEPFVFAIADPGTVISFTTFGFASLDSTSFELGIGLGAQSVNDPDLDVEPGTGTVVTEFIRLGSRDGLHLAARTDIVLFHQEFSFAAFNGTLQLPIGSNSWLLGRAGGGPTGYAFGEFGLRSLLRGRGDRGSSFVMVTAGWAGAFQSCDETFSEESGSFVSSCEQKGYEGPLVRVGLERRF